MTPEQLKRYDELVVALGTWTDNERSEAEGLRNMYLSISVDLVTSREERGWDELISRSVELGLPIEIAQSSTKRNLVYSIARREVIASGKEIGE